MPLSIFELNKLRRYTEKIEDGKENSRNLILDLIGKTHAPKMYRVFVLTNFGAKVCPTKTPFT
jgi:hypothetical protein